MLVPAPNGSTNSPVMPVGVIFYLLWGDSDAKKEAASGLEPENRGFADLRLTTWLSRLQIKGSRSGEEFLNVSLRVSLSSRTLEISGRRGLNPRPQPWQGCALPAELLPRCLRNIFNYRPLSSQFQPTDWVGAVKTLIYSLILLTMHLSARLSLS